MIASSSSSPPTRIDCETTIPPSEITATSLVPPPMSTTIEPVGSPTGRAGRPAAGLPGAGAEAGLLDRALLDAGDAGRHADDDAGVSPAVLVHLLDEVAQHLLGDLEVGDHPVLQRPNRRDRAGRASEHSLGLDPDGMDLAVARVNRDDARLGQHDATPAYVDEGV